MGGERTVCPSKKERRRNTLRYKKKKNTSCCLIEKEKGSRSMGIERSGEGEQVCSCGSREGAMKMGE